MHRDGWQFILICRTRHTGSAMSVGRIKNEKCPAYARSPYCKYGRVHSRAKAQSVFAKGE